MSPRRAARILFSVLLLLLATAMPAFAQKTIDDLCRTHGIGGEENLRRIERAYVAAVQSGIPEDVLLSFVEDILRHKLDCGQMVRVLDVTTRLRQADLPYFVVFSKVREGVAKEAPPARVVEAAEAKFNTLTASRVVLESLGSMGYAIVDRQNAAVVVSSYIEKGYSGEEIVSQIGKKGIQGAGFAALSGVVEKSVKRKER
jgi:hypothetical protein